MTIIVRFRSVLDNYSRVRFGSVQNEPDQFGSGLKSCPLLFGSFSGVRRLDASSEIFGADLLIEAIIAPMWAQVRREIFSSVRLSLWSFKFGSVRFGIVALRFKQLKHSNFFSIWFTDLQTLFLNSQTNLVRLSAFASRSAHCWTFSIADKRRKRYTGDDKFTVTGTYCRAALAPGLRYFGDAPCHLQVAEAEGPEEPEEEEEQKLASDVHLHVKECAAF